MPLSPGQVAFMPARLGVARLAATRLGYYQSAPAVLIDGVARTTTTMIKGLTVNDLLNGTPNTATVRVWQYTPVHGDEIKIGLGGLGTGQLEFAGHILTKTQVYMGVPEHIAYDLSCISYEWLLNRRKVSKRYQVGSYPSATAIILDLMANFTSGFSTAGVEANLPAIDEITFTNEDVIDCLDRICKRIAADWVVDYGKVLRVFSTSTGAVHDITDADVHGMVGIAVTTDLSQVRTRVLVEGMGAPASTDIAVGQTTMPLDDTTFASAAGGTVVSGPQRIAYTSKSTIDGTGSKVGGKTGLAPGIPTTAVIAGTAGNMEPGDYRYAVSFVINGGETEAGNNSSAVTITNVTSPSGTGNATGTTGGSLISSTAYAFIVTYVTAIGETLGAASFGTITLGASDTAISLTSIPTSADGRVTKRRIYRTGSGFSLGFGLDTVLNDNSTTTATLTKADTALGVALPTVNTSGSGQVSVTNIPIGPAGTTARKLYRSPKNVVSNSGYKFLDTVTGNVTTTYTDNTPDSSLGDALPLTSTVGPSAGDTTLPVQELSAFASGGGWVNVANQLIRYTGRSGSSGIGTLTGVPASGIGAITAAVSYDVAVINAPHLTGVTGILYAINRGESVNLLVTRNDTTAQTAMAALVGGDGIHEHYIQDRRLSQTEAENRGDAALLELKDPITTVRYQTRDKTTKAGRTVTINLGAPTSLSGTFKIQRVTSSNYVAAAVGSGWPLRTVEASSRLLTFEQLLRTVKAV